MDAGHLWVAERLENSKTGAASRVDQFNAMSGVFTSPQLDEEANVSFLYEGIAVGHPGGEEQIYVGGGREGNRVVAVFGSLGKLEPDDVWTGEAVVGGHFDLIQGLAVDNSGDLDATGDVYVADSGSGPGDGVVDVFAGEAGGKEPDKTIGVLTGFESPHGVAVANATGDVLVSDGLEEECALGKAECVVDRFEPTAMPGVYSPLPPIKGPPGKPFERLGPMATDADGDIYVAEKQENVVDQFSASGAFLGQITGTSQGPFRSLTSIAVDPASGNIYVGGFNFEQIAGAIDVFGPTRVVPDVTTSGSETRVRRNAGGEGEVEATLRGMVDPLGEGEATCSFAWGLTAAFGEQASCAASVPNGTGAIPVSAMIKAGLAPDTTYHFRLQAGNQHGTNSGEVADDLAFTTSGPGIRSASASEVAGTSASLNATIDPDGAPTSYYFQYGKSAEYGIQVPAAPGGSLGSGLKPVAVTPAHIQSLSPGAAYHYRVVAVSMLEIEGVKQTVVFPGPDHVFTTQAASAGEVLSDGRRWEQVTPVDTHGSVPEAIGIGDALQAAADGSAISYVATLPTEGHAQGNLLGGVQVFASRGASGWSSDDISLAHASAVGLTAGGGQEYRAFSSDLSTALVEHFGPYSSLAPEVFPPDIERTPYIRHDGSCASAPGTCYQPLLLGCPGGGKFCESLIEEQADVPAGQEFGGTETTAGSVIGNAKFVGASPDLAHIAVASEAQLTSTPTGGHEELYEISPDRPPSERVQLISLLPPNESGKELPAQEAGLGVADLVTRGAVSVDGSRVVWSDGEAQAQNPHLYLRSLVSGKTVQLDVPTAECLASEQCEIGEGAAHFQQASANGSRVLFTDTHRLTSDAGKTPKQADLYECDITETGGSPRCDLTDLTPAPAAGGSADLQGAMISASTDDSWVYFVANGLLGDAAARGASTGDCKMNGEVGEGECSLYVQHEGATHFIASLSGQDYADWTGRNPSDLNDLTARVSPDGRYLGFMSSRSLTGYDNDDVSSGEPDEEVFLYHAETSASGALVCASCNPSGARPKGVEYADLSGTLVGGTGLFSSETWVAANVPGWTPYELSHALYQSRYLSDSGRLFFNSDDALVQQDINNTQDVYEYEPAGVGSCDEATAAFNVGKAGCVALISSGRASEESAFLDASENGDDVFFLTNERLVPQDVDTATDIYDAHACSSKSPCPEAPRTPPPCVTAESCRTTPAPQPPVFGAPASATFSGRSNLTPAIVVVTKATVTKPSRTALLAKALKVCRARRPKAKRLKCERTARAKYHAAAQTKIKRKPKTHKAVRR